MVVYKCNTCSKLNEEQAKCFRTEHYVPKGWITMDLKYYHNDQHSDSLVKIIGDLDKLLHFCSNDCFLNHFFWKPQPVKKIKISKSK